MLTLTHAAAVDTLSCIRGLQTIDNPNYCTVSAAKSSANSPITLTRSKSGLLYAWKGKKGTDEGNECVPSAAKTDLTLFGWSNEM